MRIKSFILRVFILCSIIKISASRTLECLYDASECYWVVCSKHDCKSQNDLNITSPNSTKVDSVTGTLRNGRTKEENIFFYTVSKTVYFFPSGLEVFFPNLKGIVIWYCKLKEVHQSDLKPYSKLTYLSLPNNDIQVIEEDLFVNHPNMEMVLLSGNKIFHISPTVFDRLFGLVSLYLNDNVCISKNTENNRNVVLQMISSIKSQCTSPEYLELDKQLKALENYTAISKNLESFEVNLANSNFYNIQSFKKRIIAISHWKLQIQFANDLNDTLNSFSKTLKDIDINVRSLRSNMNDELQVVKYRVEESSEINGIWKSALVISCTFFGTIVVFIIYRKILFQTMSWNDDEV